MRKLLLATVFGVGLIALAPAPSSAAPVLVADGVTYQLTYSVLDNFTDKYTFTITGQNSGTDTEGGRTGINAFAFTLPTAFLTANFIPPPSGYNFVPGGLNSSGCNSSGGFFCFDNTNIPPTPTTLLDPTQAIVFNFTLTTSTAHALDSWDPHMKIDWVGTKNNYDLVSLAIPLSPTPPTPAPEPASLAVLGVGLLGLGYVTRRRQRGNAAAA